MKKSKEVLLKNEIEDQESLELNFAPNSSFFDINTEIRISKENSNVFQLLKQEMAGKLVVSPNFQRKNIWDIKRQSQLIESILMGVPIPPIYLYEDRNAVRQIIDGKQRITAIKKFINNEFYLDGIYIYKELVGKKFNDIPYILQSKIEDYQIYLYVIQPPTPEYIKYNIFERVNRGGVVLNKQEMRYALYQGKCTKLIVELAESKEFKFSTNNSISSNRMRDSYIILRFLAFYLYFNGFFKSIEYDSDIDSFLEFTMSFINSESDFFIHKLKQICLNGMRNSYDILGNDCFRFESKVEKRKRPINMGLFEMIVFSFSQINYTNLNKYNKRNIKEKIFSYKKYIDSKGLFLNSLDSVRNVEFRFNLALYIAQEIKND